MSNGLARMLSAAKTLATPLVVLTSAAIVWQGSTAAFNVTTTNQANTWATGTVTLTDDDSSTALFTATDLMPGATGSKCIVVTYTSAASAAEIRLYGTGSGTLADNLDLVIEEGTGGSFADCTGFAASGTVFTGDLTAWNAKTDYATGVGSHAVTAGAAQTITYKVSYTVENVSSALNKSGAASFTWEAKTP
jgi:hypothetical protein